MSILFPIIPFLMYQMPVQLRLLLLAYLQFRLTLRNRESYLDIYMQLRLRQLPSTYVRKLSPSSLNTSNSPVITSAGGKPLSCSIEDNNGETVGFFKSALSET